VSAEAQTGAPTRTYQPHLAANWWLKQLNYFLYMVRDFTPVGFAAWLIWFLVEIARLKQGPAGYHPHVSPWFIAFSVVALILATWHSVTFLSLAGRIIRVPLGRRDVNSRVITVAHFVLWAVASVVVGFLLIWLGR
jgi:fumarate reductase subunit C